LFPLAELYSCEGLFLTEWHARHCISAKARISVTTLHTSSELPVTDPKKVLAERHAMAKAGKLGNQGDCCGGDPIAAALIQMHVAVVSEALPDDIRRLLDEIDTKIAAQNKPH
jgi:hypothetical protein